MPRIIPTTCSVKVERKEKQIAVNLSNNDAQTKTYYNCILNVKLK